MQQARLEELVEEATSRLLERFDKRLAYDAFKEQQVTRLHAELQEYKGDLLAKALRPLILGMVRLHDDVGRIESALRQREPDELTPERFFTAIGGFRDDIELLLGQHGVEPFRLPGDDFDPRRQTAVGTVPCADPERVGRVVGRLRPGFARGEETLTRERVVVAAPADGEPDHPDREDGTHDTTNGDTA